VLILRVPVEGRMLLVAQSRREPLRGYWLRLVTSPTVRSWRLLWRHLSKTTPTRHMTIVPPHARSPA
jgi:hypothetical protein